MINSDYDKFINNLYYGDEFEISYNGKQYFIQSYYKKDFHNIEVLQWKPLIEGVLWKSVSKEPQENIDKFLKSNIFDCQAFIDIEPKVEWLDIGTIETK